MKLKIKTLICSALAALSMQSYACYVDGTNTGKVTAKVVGIEVRENCTYLLLSNVSTTLPVIDNGPFTPGRFTYLSLDPQNTSYDSMLTLATMAYATGTKVYANVTSRTARVNYFSISDQENNN